MRVASLDGEETTAQKVSCSSGNKVWEKEKKRRRRRRKKKKKEKKKKKTKKKGLSAFKVNFRDCWDFQSTLTEIYV